MLYLKTFLLSFVLAFASIIACDVMRAVMLESKHNFITQLVSYALGYAPKWHLH